MADVHLTDPLGNQITLHEVTWQRHIARRHPAISLYREHVERAITAPTIILKSNADPDCLVYYGQCPGQFGEIQVVADIRRGFIKTAFLRLGRTAGEQLWPRSTPSKA